MLAFGEGVVPGVCGQRCLQPSRARRAVRPEGALTASSDAVSACHSSGLERRDIRGKLGLVPHGCGQDGGRTDLERQARLDTDGERVLFEPDFVAAVHLAVVEDPVLLEQREGRSVISSGSASSVVFRFLSPRFSASMGQAAEYPSPLKTTAPCSVMIVVSRVCTASSKSVPAATAASSSLAQ